MTALHSASSSFSVFLRSALFGTQFMKCQGESVNDAYSRVKYGPNPLSATFSALSMSAIGNFKQLMQCV